jgi:hypothetical protein
MHRYTTIHRKRKEKRREEHKKFGVFFSISVACVCGIIGLLAWGSHHNAVSVSSVRVEGVKTIDEESVISMAQQELEGNNFLIWNRANMLWYPKKDIVADIQEAFPRAKDISLRRTSMTAIAVEITERTPTYVWCEGSYIDYEQDAALVGETHQPTCYFADCDGFIFDSAPVFSGAAYRTWYGGEVTHTPLGAYIANSDVFARSVAVMDTLSALGLSPIKHEFRGEDGYVFFEDDTYFMYPLDAELEALGADVRAVLESLEENTDWEYLDMRFGNKVFFREKGEENVE